MTLSTISSDGGAAAVTTDFGVNVFSTFCVIAPDNKLILKEINPMNAVKNLEDALLPDFDPVPMSCSSTSDRYQGNYYQLNVSKNNIYVFFYKPVHFHISVFDLTGKELFAGDFKDSLFRLDVNDYKKGIYLLQVQYKNRLKVHKIFID